MNATRWPHTYGFRLCEQATPVNLIVLISSMLCINAAYLSSITSTPSIIFNLVSFFPSLCMAFWLSLGSRVMFLAKEYSESLAFASSYVFARI